MSRGFFSLGRGCSQLYRGFAIRVVSVRSRLPLRLPLFGVAPCSVGGCARPLRRCATPLSGFVSVKGGRSFLGSAPLIPQVGRGLQGSNVKKNLLVSLSLLGCLVLGLPFGVVVVVVGLVVFGVGVAVCCRGGGGVGGGFCLVCCVCVAFSYLTGFQC